ncbi:hypothetical protein SWPG_00166 [Synechococcus phage S-CBM2]|nr:hypothetical protein SWPG_00166 [Synechococcus phage S-CBM2]
MILGEKPLEYNINDINLDEPLITDDEKHIAAVAGILSLKEDLKSLLTRIEAIENHLINNSVPHYKPPGRNEYLSLGKVLDDIYSQLQNGTK